MTSTERADILETLTKHRELFRFTVQGLTDEQASTRSSNTASELTLGGLIKHVTQVEKRWADFIVDGPADEPAVDWANIDWTNPPPEVLKYWRASGWSTARPSQDCSSTTPRSRPPPTPWSSRSTWTAATRCRQAPWFTPGSRWSARRAFLHILAETAQHAGHADIIRESLDGQKSMG